MDNNANKEAFKKNIFAKIFSRNQIKAFSLLELMVVVIIVAIIVSLALPNFRKAYLDTQDREAISMLKLIQQGLKIYYLENNVYGACGDTSNCNAFLRLSLTSKVWNYSVPNATCTTYCTSALPLGASAGTGNWSLRDTQTEPVSGECP